MIKKIILAMTLSVGFAGCFTDSYDSDAVKVLMIGNSFSLSCLQHLPQVAKDRGVKLELGSLYIGGCSLKRHWDNVENESELTVPPYQYKLVRRGKSVVKRTNIPQALRSCPWDIVTIQQASPDSWKSDTYHPYGDKLVELIRELAPQAKIVVQETWSYSMFDRRLKKWGIDQNEMYAKLHAAYADFAGQHQLEVLPMGTAIQAWRRELPVKYTERSFGGDLVGGRSQQVRDQFKRDYRGEWTVNCDTSHLNERGEYFQALVWAGKLLEVDLSDIEYRPDFVTEDEQRLMLKIVDSL